MLKIHAQNEDEQLQVATQVAYLQIHIKRYMRNMNEGITFWARFNFTLIIEYKITFIWLKVN